MDYAIEVNNLNKSYGLNNVLKGVNFSVYKGEVFALLGINGAGKTTILECLEGLRKYNSGNIKINGKFGVQLQSSSIPHNMKVSEAFILFAKWNHVEINEEYIFKLGIDSFKKKQYSQLSIGQKRRLHLALALLGDPDIIFLDEPTAGLDVEGREAIHKEVKNLKAQGKTIILASHDMSEVEKLCDRIAILKEGKIVFCGTTVKLTETNQNQCILQISLSNDINLYNIKTCMQIDKFDNYYNFKTVNLEDTIFEIVNICRQHNIKIKDIRIKHMELEQRFLKVAKEGL